MLLPVHSGKPAKDPDDFPPILGALRLTLMVGVRAPHAVVAISPRCSSPFVPLRFFSGHWNREPPLSRCAGVRLLATDEGCPSSTSAPPVSCPNQYDVFFSWCTHRTKVTGASFWQIAFSKNGYGIGSTLCHIKPRPRC